ncbi:MAG TPA: hypothetical protein VFW40_09895, partial [Capsulimonadaceae bacterium]|nr:hypothetical protein [Capsulimonadaceae bacterium]
MFVICLFLLAPALAGASSLKLAYVQHGWLYTVRIDRTGVPVRGAKPVRIRPIPVNTSISLVGSPNGRYVAATIDYGIQLISLVNHKIMSWPDTGSEPSFSPDGRHMAYVSGDDDLPDVRTLNIETGHVRILRSNVFKPFWSADGKEIACLEDLTEKSGDGYGLILNARTGKVDFRTETGINPTDLILSANGRYLATLNHLSRPLLGHEITDRRPDK